MEGTPRVLFVSGDVGGAAAQVPVVKKGRESSVFEPKMITDAHPTARAQEAWKRASLPFEQVSHGDQGTIDTYLEWADVVVSGTCATAYFLERAILKRAKDLGKRSVVLSDSIFSHCFTYFRDVEPTIWTAIDESHRESIVNLHPCFTPDRVVTTRVVTTGQPTYDNLKRIMAEREVIREKHRRELDLSENDYVLLLYPSPALKAATFEGSLDMALRGVPILKEYHGDHLVLLPSIHPKIGGVFQSKDYVDGLKLRIEAFCKIEGIRFVYADKVPLDELDVTVDLFVCGYCTDAEKSVYMGGLVIHLLSDSTQWWLEHELLQMRPYLASLKKGAALGALKYHDIAPVFKESQHRETQATMRACALVHFSLPEKSATESVVGEILKLAGS